MICHQDHTRLESMHGIASRRDRSVSVLLAEGSPSFIELPPALALVQECVIEFEEGEVSLRVHLKGYNATDVAAVGRSMRGSQ